MHTFFCLLGAHSLYGNCTSLLELIDDVYTAVFINYGYIDPSFSYYYRQMNADAATYVWENKSLKTNIKRIARYNQKYAGGNPPIYYIYPQVTMEEYEKRVSTIISICESLYSLPEFVTKKMKCDFFLPIAERTLYGPPHRSIVRSTLHPRK